MKLYLLLLLPAIAAGCVSPLPEAALPVVARYAETPPVIDGKTDDPAWRQAEWVTLDGSRPARPLNEAEWEFHSAVSGGLGYVEEQFNQKTSAAALWNEKGLYFALSCEDVDVQALAREGGWIWLGDVCELFLAPRAAAGAPIWELQVNPANARFMQPKLPVVPVTAAHVEGTPNDSARRDAGWSVEIFLPWEQLEKAGLARRPCGNDPWEAAAVRFAAWDLSIYTQERINRFTTPGRANPHHPEQYRPLRCLTPSRGTSAGR